MMITNNRFWKLWKNEQYEKALSCPIKEETQDEENRIMTTLFGGKDQFIQSNVIVAISVGELLYDLIMIDPTVVKGLDFARTDDLSSLFTLSKFASEIDTSVMTGDMAQLQGYVAEQMLAAELQAKGHDVEFPEDANNPGWDILVDGQPFQVKNVTNPDAVKEHLERYPNIPVYVNEELAPYFENHPNVYISNISHQEVIDETVSTLVHAEGLLDFEIPWITAGVSSFYNIKNVWKNETTIQNAVVNIFSDTSSRVVLGALGKKTGIIVGTTLFGPAGGIIFAMVGTYAGVLHGGKLSSHIKRTFAKKEEIEVLEANHSLMEKMKEQINCKLEIKRRKLKKLQQLLYSTKANRVIFNEVERRQHEEILYLSNKKEELSSIVQNRRNVIEVVTDTMALIPKCGIHSYFLQDEIHLLRRSLDRYLRKIK